MAVPRNRHSVSRTKKKRSHNALKLKSMSKCSNCSKACLAHKMCPFCGFYAGRAVVHAEKEEKQ